jgi:hypothetical protein
MARSTRQRNSSVHGKFVSVARFRELECEVLQMRDAMESIRHESSDNLRRCGELQYEMDKLKKATRGSNRAASSGPSL